MRSMSTSNMRFPSMKVFEIEQAGIELGITELIDSGYFAWYDFIVHARHDRSRRHHAFAE